MFHFPKHLADRQTQNNSVLILSKFPMINFWPPAILKEDFLQDLPMVCFVVTQHSESRVSHSVFATPKHLAKQPPKKNPFPKTVNCQTVTLVTQKKSFLETVICYLLFVTQKIHLWKLSTVKL